MQTTSSEVKEFIVKYDLHTRAGWYGRSMVVDALTVDAAVASPASMWGHSLVRNVMAQELSRD